MKIHFSNQFSLQTPAGRAYSWFKSDRGAKAKFHYALWFEAGSKLVAVLLARASSLLAS